MPKVHCNNCQNTCYKGNREIIRDKHHFCCRDCYTKFMHNNSSWIRCHNCNKKIKIIQYDIDHYDYHFCNRKCHDVWRRRKIEVICDFCKKKKFKITPYFFNRNKNHFCSLKCHGRWISENKSGKNSHMWRGGKSSEQYDSSFNDDFKKRIRKRDHQRCQLCGINRYKLNRELDIHHIDYDKLNTKFDNCVALCNRCNLTVNLNQTYYIEFFHNVLNKKYGYVYGNKRRRQINQDIV